MKKFDHRRPYRIEMSFENSDMGYIIITQPLKYLLFGYSKKYYPIEYRLVGSLFSSNKIKIFDSLVDAQNYIDRYLKIAKRNALPIVLFDSEKI